MTGSLQKRGNVWSAVINEVGEGGKRKQRWISTKQTKKSDAQKVLYEILAKMGNGTYIDPVKTLFSDFMLDWLDNTIKNEVEETTWDGYCDNIKVHIVPYFKAKGIKLQELKPIHLKQYFDEKLKIMGRSDGRGGLSVNTLKKQFANIKKALEFAKEMEMVNNNPAKHVNLPKIKKYKANYYTVEQLEVLLEITKETIIEAAVYIAVHYGLRRGEVLGLRWKDIIFTKGTITIRKQRTRVRRKVEKEPKSEASIRTLPLIPRVSEYLQALEKQQVKDKDTFGDSYINSDYVCRYQDGTPVNITTLDHKFSSILESSRMPHVRFHDLRHSTGSYLIKNGISLREIQVWLGHSDISVTTIYTGVDTEMKQATANKINEIFTKR